MCMRFAAMVSSQAGVAQFAGRMLQVVPVEDEAGAAAGLSEGEDGFLQRGLTHRSETAAGRVRGRCWPG